MTTTKTKTRKPQARRMTDIQRRFVDEYLIDLKPKAAAIRAGYKEANADRMAHRLLHETPLVMEAIKQAQAKLRHRAEVTQDEVIADLRELRDICLGRKAVKVTQMLGAGEARAPVEVETTIVDPAGAARALDMLAKHTGLYELDNKQKHPIQEMSDDMLRRYIAQKAKEVGLDMPAGGAVH
jgi:phage terminase small subunit